LLIMSHGEQSELESSSVIAKVLVLLFLQRSLFYQCTELLKDL
jgi:hypothetical protein